MVLTNLVLSGEEAEGFFGFCRVFIPTLFSIYSLRVSPPILTGGFFLTVTLEADVDLDPADVDLDPADVDLDPAGLIVGLSRNHRHSLFLAL